MDQLWRLLFLSLLVQAVYSYIIAYLPYTLSFAIAVTTFIIIYGDRISNELFLWNLSVLLAYFYNGLYIECCVLLIISILIICMKLEKEQPKRIKKIKIDFPRKQPNYTKKKKEFIKTSSSKKKYYAKSFPTLKEYVKDLKSNKSAANKLTSKILSNKPSGDTSNKDTLLHILNGAAKKNGKKCVFFDSSKNIISKSKYTKDSYLNMVDENNENSPKFVLTLKNLNGLIGAKNGSGKKQDKSDKLLALKECIQSNKYNPTIDKIRSNLAKAHNVSKQRIVITDIYLNGVGCPYYIKDLTPTEKDRIITETTRFEQKMKTLFDDYDKFSIHPALFHHSYDIAMFDALGNKTFGPSENGKYKVGPNGKKREYVQPTGWTRYGLKVLNKYDNNKWLTPFQDAGNWYRAYHGTSRVAGSSIFNTQFRSGSNNVYGKGIYCTPDINIAASYCRSRGGTVSLDTVKGKKEFYFVFQVAVNPATMNNPSLIPNFNPACENVKYWIAPTGADIRPYGILIKEV